MSDLPEPPFVMMCEVCHLEPHQDPNAMFFCVGVDPATGMPVFRCQDHAVLPKPPLPTLP
jgi:hypothetical protein